MDGPINNELKPEMKQHALSKFFAWEDEFFHRKMRNSFSSTAEKLKMSIYTDLVEK